jgi:hypothetical protein
LQSRNSGIALLNDRHRCRRDSFAVEASVWSEELVDALAIINMMCAVVQKSATWNGNCKSSRQSENA